MNTSKMMRKSVSHPKIPTQHPTTRLQWLVFLSIGSLTILTGIALLIALMSPENIRSAPTITLVCVLILLCVPVPVLMLERTHRKAAISASRATPTQPQRSKARPSRKAVIHQPHTPHDSNPESHRTHREKTERKHAPEST